MHFFPDIDTGLTVSLLYILLIYWQFFVILILTLVYQSLLSTFFCCQPLFSRFKRFIFTILFPVQMLLGQPLFLRFLALINPSSFLILRSSNQSFFFFFWCLVKYFGFLFIGCVWFLLLLKGKCSIFRLS